MKERKTVQINLPIDVETGEHGLVYVTCPLIRGLLLALETDAEIAHKVEEAITEMSAEMEAHVAPPDHA